MLHIAAPAAVIAGRLDPANGRHVLALLDRALDGCLAGEFDAMVTAPVQKSTINDAGVAFTGHTEYLAERTGAAQVVMMLAGGGLRVALATTHLPLSAVPAAITREGLARTLRVVDQDLRSRFGIDRPRILVAGLNPHAGESGHLGREEIDVIAPALEIVRREGIRAEGPLPADTLFTARVLAGADAVLAMYHDQGLPVLKHASFGHAVNVTLGLPVIRTSVDHGTALDLAGAGRGRFRKPGGRGGARHRPRAARPRLGGAMLPRPKKRLGQHFLTDRHYLARIVAEIAPQAGDAMVEIGPGPGALTERLTQIVRPLHVVEIDRELAAGLRARFAPEQVIVHEADALDFDFACLPAGLRVVGNLPYNVSTPLLFHVASFAPRIRDCVFMLQKEVVERMVAEPATADYGRLSVMLQYRFSMSLAFRVPPGAFTPPPKVDSALVRMAPLGEGRLTARDEAHFGRVVMAAFTQRRKTLRNALRALVTPERVRARRHRPGSAGRDAVGRAVRRPRRRFGRGLALLDELDLVAVGILDEGDHAAAELHRPGLPRDLPAQLLHVLARLVGVRHRDGDVAEGIAEVVGPWCPSCG